MYQNNITDLLERYNNGTATEHEIAILQAWYLKHPPVLNELPPGQLEEDQQRSIDSLLTVFGVNRKRNLWPAIAAAASLLIFISIYLYYQIVPIKQQPVYAAKKQHEIVVPPGGNKATITLSDGSVIVLSGAKNGTLASQGEARINKTADGQVRYVSPDDHGKTNTIAYNTATTPRGGQYQFILADGTKVWLNAGSSIKFPVVFTGNERKVELKGEAYFEVVHDANKPFRVVSNGQTVEDLGTHFNINAYGDEPFVKTTLLEGSVSIAVAGQKRIMKPGEQAQLKNGGLNVVNMDTEDAVAWKNGFFHFDDSSIQDVARQLSRWYDVDIRYEGELTTRLFSGDISRNVTASQLLDILSFKRIHYRIEEKAIVILP